MGSHDPQRPEGTGNIEEDTFVSYFPVVYIFANALSIAQILKINKQKKISFVFSVYHFFFFVDMIQRIKLIGFLHSWALTYFCACVNLPPSVMVSYPPSRDTIWLMMSCFFFLSQPHKTLHLFLFCCQVLSFFTL